CARSAPGGNMDYW
nr:immunoglobulin heavy chain junction region [Mus musculus]